jgi:hypothetical protein
VTPAERFWAKVEVRGPDECWPWLAATSPKGYGNFWVAGRYVNAHRFAYELANGLLGPGLCALHTCDNQSCCNKRHLFSGTKGDNNRDCARKGRAKVLSKGRPGEMQARAKLNPAAVVVIRLRFAQGVTRAQLARDFAVSWPLVDGVVKGRLWAHVPTPIVSATA